MVALTHMASFATSQRFSSRLVGGNGWVTDRPIQRDPRSLPAPSPFFQRQRFVDADGLLRRPARNSMPGSGELDGDTHLPEEHAVWKARSRSWKERWARIFEEGDGRHDPHPVVGA